MSPTTGRRLVLVRHGRTGWNALGRGQGHSDTELDDLGHTQAEAVAPALAAYQPVALWSSDLARARQTAAYVAKETGLDPVFDARLREYHLGERTGLTMAEFEQQFPDEYADHLAGRLTAVPGGETTAEVRARTAAALGDVLDALEPGETAVVVGHGASLKVAVADALDWPDELAVTLQSLGNCASVVLDEVAYAGRLRLAGYNLPAS